LRKASLQLARPRKEKHNYGKRRNHLGPRNDCRYMCAANWVTVACSCSPTGSRTVTFARVSRVDAVIPTSGLVTALQPVLRGAQRTYGTTDPGGRLAPRPSEGMLNNPLKVLTPKMTNQPPTTCIVFGTQHAYPTLPRLARSYRLVFAGRRATNHPVQVGSFRVSETGLPCTKDVFLPMVCTRVVKHMRIAQSHTCTK